MNPKVTAIILFVVGAGIALYIFNSGGAARLASVFKAPASSTTAAAVEGSSTTSNASGTASSSGISNFFSQFFSLVFRGPATSTYAPPTVSDGSGASGGSNSQTYISEPGSGSSQSNATASIPAYEIPTGYTAAQLSPYFHVIRFEGVSTYEISLYIASYSQTTSTIDITGWEIKTNRGGEYIPQAIDLYDPLGSDSPTDIILYTNQQDTVYMYSNSAPANVRTNECMGYLSATANQFNPELPDSCPSIDYSVITNFSGQCQNYIESLGSCGTVNMTDPRIPEYDYACQQYLENNFTYRSCIANHDRDPNFLGNTWDVWMGGTPLDPYHDNVVLLDRNGLVVDAYSY